MENVMKPDVTFGEQNDRFDLTNFIRRQKKIYKEQTAFDRQSEEYRRRGKDDKSWMDLFSTKKDRKKIRNFLIRRIEDHANQIANTLITKLRSLRRQEDFAYHDNMVSDETSIHDYERNLKSFNNTDLLEKNRSRRLQDIVHRLHGQETRRIVLKPEKEILLHYALPVKMKIEGFLQPAVNGDNK
ncbi:unnamed protein product [Danaus chrysippus]|uniref:(African queen) hypothetical protein n=1 Tax=Danaus chrysippus TaxID=151541 RepID=A0A8J2QUQ9_9NEOP|nr:unnamed protein product [Danaus chrysippus]